LEPGGCLQKPEDIGFAVKWEAENENYINIWAKS